MVKVLSTFVLAMMAVPPLYAYRGDEHILIGEEAYYLACDHANEQFGSSADLGVLSRLKIACTRLTTRTKGAFAEREMFPYESLMGEWSALAADHTRSPSELFDIGLGDMVVDYRVMTVIAVTNYRHFHPTSVLSWREEHAKSLEAALEASRATGLQLSEGFEQALARQAFAQHYLQDSFASGHMGFNRVASSNAAALSYHNYYNKSGRCVMNLKEEVWITYGDGYLDCSVKDERPDCGTKDKQVVTKGKEQVIHAAALSLYDLLATFIEGSIDAGRGQDVWTELPAYYKAQPSYLPVTCDSDEKFQPLRSVSRAASSVATFDAKIVSDGALLDDGVEGFIASASQEYPLTIPVGYRVIQSRFSLGVGVITKQSSSQAFLADAEYIWHIANSLSGTLSHEVGVGELAYFKSFNDGQVSARAFYAVSVEAGRVYIRLQAGAAHRRGGIWAPHLSLGLGWVQRSRRR